MWLWLFSALILLYLYRKTRPLKEGATNYQEYDEQTCLALATQNQDNITALQTALDSVLALQTQVTNIQSSVSANTTTLQTLTDQVTGSVGS
jgi:hypothetical protein